MASPPTRQTQLLLFLPKTGKTSFFNERWNLFWRGDVIVEDWHVASLLACRAILMGTGCDPSLLTDLRANQSLSVVHVLSRL
jgi:hypothetical protein